VIEKEEGRHEQARGRGSRTDWLPSKGQKSCRDHLSRAQCLRMQANKKKRWGAESGGMVAGISRPLTKRGVARGEDFLKPKMFVDQAACSASSKGLLERFSFN